MKTVKNSWHKQFGPFALLAAVLLVTWSCAKPAAPAKTAADESAEDATVEEVAVVEVEEVKPAATSDVNPRYTQIDDMGEKATDGATAIPALTKMLADSDKQVQWRSARALGDFGAAAMPAAPELLKLLSSDDPIVQYHAAIALGRIGDKSETTVDALVNAVGSADPRVSRAAVAAIKNLQPGPVKVHAALKKALEAGDTAVTVNALDAIVEIGGKASPLLIECLGDPDTAYLAAAAIEQIGPDAAPTAPALGALLDKTDHSQLEIRALLALAAIGPAAKPAVPQIIKALETSKDATVPVAAAYALGAIDAEEADAQMRAALEKDNPFLQMVAAWSLAKMHPEDADLKKQAMDKLGAGMKSDDPAMKAAAEKGMKMLEPPAEAAPAASAAAPL